MVLKHWSLPTLSDLFYRHDGGQTSTESPSQTAMEGYNQALAKAEREWSGAIAAMEELLTPSLTQGILLSSTATPLLSDRSLFSDLLRGVFTTEGFNRLSLTSSVLPAVNDTEVEVNSDSILQFPLLPNDPLIDERYALLFTREFSLAIILGKDNSGFPKLHFSFAPELMQGIWETLRTRLFLTNHEHLGLLEAKITEFSPIEPNYRQVTEFSRNLLKNLPDTPDLDQKKNSTKKLLNKEIELLQALTHEIRTPLTTIRTLTRLLLKRSSQLNQEALKRLEMIDQECTEQINRMDLIFKVTELETQSLNYPMQLLPISLEKLFQENIPRWQKQSQRRNVVLEVVLPQKLPVVLGDPTMLAQILTNLMEKITRDLATGGRIKVQVTIVGSQLKLELLSTASTHTNPLKSLGQLLMFQPETGSLSLNIDVTKNLFNLMGGKLTVRHHEQKGEVVTIFLPLTTIPSSRIK
ncbi:HAMP domain-containing sensor histidine kinase [Gloeocapsa sp. PCC 73106]|uniref:sensor histidine kinase n=1 Tax=Gloeocapsa sp. PCC 73106 TaxID=102232 RepID=UPI0002AC73DA|nr:HAMP domain-containing sensor histidine kinase [Gloeocapsa sp. PCC 73106]ELR99677.1 histidine kinase [Gloeocapsa sp. PCC 73106]